MALLDLTAEELQVLAHSLDCHACEGWHMLESEAEVRVAESLIERIDRELENEQGRSQGTG